MAKALLEQNLIACANILPAHEALYKWEGKVETGAEHAVILKTRKALFDKVEAAIKALHPHDVPCIVSWPIEQGHTPFMQWIEDETQP